MTLTELLVAVTLMGIVATAFINVMLSLQTNVIREQARSTNNDQARLAIEQLDREIRSGNVLYDPAGESPAGYTLRVYTQSNAPTSTPAFRCVQWAITTSQDLVRRSWPPSDPGAATSWRIIAEHIVNRDVSPAVPAFELDPEASKGGRTVNAVLVVNGDLSDEPSATVRVQTALTGRNTSLGFPHEVCETLPSTPIPS